MPSEKAPSKPRASIIRKGGREWRIDPEEIRLRVGAVGDDGVRRVPYFIDASNPGDTGAMIQRYKADGWGYKTSEDGLSIIFEKDESNVQADTAKMHSAAIARQQAYKDRALQADGIDAGLERLSQMTAQEFETLE